MLDPDARNLSSPVEAAAFWDVRLRSPTCTAADRAAFAAWLDEDPANAEAISALATALKLAHDGYATSPELRAFRDEAVRARPRRVAFFPSVAAAAAAVIVLVGAGVLATSALRPAATSTPQAPAPSIYQTAVGERSQVQLSDGSTVTLNTSSRLEVAFTPTRRQVTLVAGQGLFHVAKDAARPFVVTAGGRKVTAVGTEFDVRLEPTQVSVTMVEGRVRVEPTVPSSTNQEQSLVAGQKLTADAAGSVRVVMVDPHAAVSWSEGRILFEDVPLADALAEVNRYSSVRFSIGDPSLQKIRISGVFRTDQPMDFVNALAAYLPIVLRTTATEVVLTARRSR